MSNKRMAAALALIITLIVVVGITCHCTIKQSDATIERIDRKIEMAGEGR